MSDSEKDLATPQLASDLEKTGYVMLKDRPCKIVEINKTSGGKHGSGKVVIVGLDIFTDQKYDDVVPGTHLCDVPIVHHKEYTVIAVNGDVLTVLDRLTKDEREIELPQGYLGDEIKTSFDQLESDIDVVITVVSACGEEKVIGHKSIAH